jgi:hypothetical protein
MNTDLMLQNLRIGFAGHIDVRLKRPNILKVLVPLFHEDGDMLDIFVEDTEDGRVQISDYGLSLMRLSYDYDINTDTKRRIFQQILSESNAIEDNGKIIVKSDIENIYPSVLQFGQIVTRVCSLRLHRRDVVANLFYEMIDEFVKKDLSSFHPVERFNPLESREELTVDYSFANDNSPPIYMFAAKKDNIAKIRLIAVSCLEFLRRDINFQSLVVHEDFYSLPKPDMRIITNAVDKQFTSRIDFEQGAPEYIKRALAR